MLELPDSWVWDFWTADDGEQYHAFFLYASRALHDPDRRHYRASIGHAVSEDLVRWRRVQDALVRSDPPACDDQATWTGSVVRHPDGSWRMFYTGVTLTALGNQQSIVCAASPDLYSWQRVGAAPLLLPDDRWYQRSGPGEWVDESFRDPWVFADPSDDGWHMLITAGARDGEVGDQGVIGHAASPDLENWELRPPLTAPGQGFLHLEVPQVATVDGRTVLLFSASAQAMTRTRRAADPTGGGVWVAAAESPTGPFDITGAYPLTDLTLYSGRVVQLRDQGAWVLIAFEDGAANGAFAGRLCDPLPVGWRDDRLTIL